MFDIQLDSFSLVAMRHGKAIRLTFIQFEILKTIMQTQPALLGHAALMDRSWGIWKDGRPAYGTYTTTIHSLRQKLKHLELGLITKYGQGYILADAKDL